MISEPTAQSPKHPNASVCDCILSLAKSSIIALVFLARPARLAWWASVIYTHSIYSSEIDDKSIHP
jgi:hypothetical protein